MDGSLCLPTLRPATVADGRETNYSREFKKIVVDRARRALGDVLGMRQFCMNLALLAPWAASTQRHWYSTGGDEFIMILSCEVVLISDSGEQTLRVRHIAGFPGGVADGHHLVSKGLEDAKYLESGS